MVRELPSRFAGFVLALLLASPLARAAEPGFFADWQDRASATQAEQPHWITPLFTTTPRLEQELRFDTSWHPNPDGTSSVNYGGGKGLELIPARRIELIVGVPPYLVHNQPIARDGWGDASFLLKYRALARNEEHGDYIVTFFLGASVPTGTYRNGADNAVITPTIAVGKGWHAFDVQSTFGASLPTAGAATFGHPLLWNTAFQYRVLKKLWPEIETNATFWPDGSRAGNKQLFLTPGLVLGRFPIRDRLGFTVGAGMQIAATRFHTFDHNWVISARMPF